jgi:hypothetical protein
MKHAAIVLLALGCSPAPLDLGQDPDFVFFTDHETGDLSAWNAHGSTWEDAGGKLALVRSPARSGRFAVDASVVAQPVGTQSAAFLFAQDLPENAYFSAWFYLNEQVSSAYYWAFFKLAAQEQSSTDSQEIWVLDMAPGTSGSTLRLYSDVYPDEALSEPPVLPTGRWFQVEVFVRAPAPDEGELRIWVDGVQIFEHHGATLPASTVTWVIGSGADGLAAPAASLFIDDAAVTRRRLGPGFPAFWR